MLLLDLLELHWITLICIPSHPSVFNGSHSWRQTLATFTLALPARLRSKAREVMQCNAMQCLWPLSKPRRPKSTKTLRSTCSWDGELERPWTSINHRSKINPLLDEATRASEPASRKSIAASFVFAVASVRFGACLRRGVGQRERSRSLDGCLSNQASWLLARERPVDLERPLGTREAREAMRDGHVRASGRARAPRSPGFVPSQRA